MAHAVGIDLGTTNSAVAHIDEHGRPVVIPNRFGSPADSRRSLLSLLAGR